MPGIQSAKVLGAGLALLLLAAGFSATVLAGSAWSPPVRIVALEVPETADVLRLGVRRSIEINVPPFVFNPATCSSLTEDFNMNGIDVSTHYFDVQLDAAGRSAAEQRQLLNEIYAAFATSRNVSLNVRDDLCTPADGRVAAGIQVLD